MSVELSLDSTSHAMNIGGAMQQVSSNKQFAWFPTNVNLLSCVTQLKQANHNGFDRLDNSTIVSPYFFAAFVMEDFFSFTFIHIGIVYWSLLQPKNQILL